MKIVGIILVLLAILIAVALLRAVFLKPTGIEEYSYEKNGKTVTGYQFVYEKSYPKKSAKKKKK